MILTLSLGLAAYVVMAGNAHRLTGPAEAEAAVLGAQRREFRRPARSRSLY